MSKEELLNNVRNWITIDNEIRTLQKEQKIRREKKKAISENLIEFMKNNEIDCFAINDGNLSYVKRNVKKPINKKNLLDILAKYFDGDLLKANDMNEFIMDNREEYVKESIQRRVNNCDKSKSL
tara:strand:+ start:2462 stop:2833 length:372 start_codon:yes stop_codon:yes gene_type:complete